MTLWRRWTLATTAGELAGFVVAVGVACGAAMGFAAAAVTGVALVELPPPRATRPGATVEAELPSSLPAPHAGALAPTAREEEPSWR